MQRGIWNELKLLDKVVNLREYHGIYRDYMNKNKPPAVDSEASYEGNQSSTVVIDKSSFIAYQTQTQGASGAQFSNISAFDPYSYAYKGA